MELLKEFENDAGTYLKVIRFPETMNPDGFVILYLRPSGNFLFIGFWRGYEYSIAAGTWERTTSEVCLTGNGRLSLDVIPTPGGGRFHRVFTVGNANHTPSLTATAELEGWSLLGWTGPFMYIGQETIIDPDEHRMPNTLQQVDALIGEITRS